MSTEINVTVDSGGLLERSKLQTAANRQAFVEGQQRAKAEQTGKEQRLERLAAEGRDAQSNLILPGRTRSSALDRFIPQPAARRQNPVERAIFYYGDATTFVAGPDGITYFTQNTLYKNKVAASTLVLLPAGEDSTGSYASAAAAEPTIQPGASDDPSLLLVGRGSIRSGLSVPLDSPPYLFARGPLKSTVVSNVLLAPEFNVGISCTARTETEGDVGFSVNYRETLGVCTFRLDFAQYLGTGFPVFTSNTGSAPAPGDEWTQVSLSLGNGLAVFHVGGAHVGSLTYDDAATGSIYRITNFGVSVSPTSFSSDSSIYGLGTVLCAKANLFASDSYTMRPILSYR